MTKKEMALTVIERLKAEDVYKRQDPYGGRRFHQAEAGRTSTGG